MMITRLKALKNLEFFIGRNLRVVADDVGVSVYKDGKQNKWWKWLVLELCAWLTNNNSRAPNGLGFELKSVSFEKRGAKLKPRETMAITMINPDELDKQNFFESHCWNKLKSLVFCAVLWTDTNQEDAQLLEITSFDLETDISLIDEIQQDYEYIRQKYKKYGWSSLTGKDGKWIQARTKWAWHGSTSRAFYARKELVSRIFFWTEKEDERAKFETWEKNLALTLN